MSFDDVLAKTTITGFSSADKTTITDAMSTAYEGSSTAQGMFDAWIADSDHTVKIDYVSDKFQSYANTGLLELDLANLAGNSYIDNNGTAVEDTAVTAIVHELVHALAGKTDDWTQSNVKGSTVELSNDIYNELGLPEQNSYIAYDAEGDILTIGFEYTNGTSIDKSYAGDQDWESSGSSDDLMIGGPSANTIKGGGGDDWIYGGGGQDVLVGGLGLDSMDGQAGNDVYDYNAVGESVSDFYQCDGIAFADAGSKAGDRIDLSTIDANPVRSGNQSFEFLGTSTPTDGKGLAKVWTEDGYQATYGDITLVNVSTDADKDPEMLIRVGDEVAAASTWVAGDFIL